MGKLEIKNWTYPGVFGLGVYLIVRLINDTLSGENHFINADLSTILIEISTCIAVGYLMHFTWKKCSEKLFQLAIPITRQLIFKNLLLVLAISLVIINITIIPMTAFTDDGLSASDFVLINSLVILITTIWYFYAHTNYFMQVFAKAENELIQSEKERTETELTYLKSQIHPHFLFNVLNTIYFQIEEQNHSAKKTIEQLSEILRYGLYESNAQNVLISKELQYLDQYINLMATRLGDKVKVTKNYNIEEDIHIAPQMLFPLVENAFKHLAEKNGFVNIELDVNQDQINGIITNNYSKLKKKNSGGVGLQNLQRRLHLIYGQNAIMNTDVLDHTFRVHLRINKPVFQANYFSQNQDS